MDTDSAELFAKASAFGYQSTRYESPEDFEAFELMEAGDGGVFFTARRLDGGRVLHWGTDDPAELERAVERVEKGTVISFIPPEWEKRLTENLCDEFAEFCEFRCGKLSAPGVQIDYLPPRDCEEAAAITMECQWQSRGFRGESGEWIAQWAGNLEPLKHGAHCTACLEHRERGALTGIVCVALYGSPLTLWIRELAVRPACQGRGIGRRLMEKAFEYGVENGTVKAFLMADSRNAPGIALYKSMGFEANGESQIDIVRK